MPIHTLQTIPQEPEETSLSAIFYFGLLFLTCCLVLGPAGILVAAVIFLLRRYLSLEDLCEDWAETCCCEQSSSGRRALFEGYNRLDFALYRNATHIWCAEWYKALRDRESCVRTYAHAHAGTPAPCQ